MPPPVPTKPKGPTIVPYCKPGLNTGTFPKAKPHNQQPQSAPGRSPLLPSQSQTLPLPTKQDTPPAATVRPFTPELPSSKDSSLSKPQTLAASSIYSMYTQQPGTGKPFQPGVQGALNRSQSRTNGFVSGKNRPLQQHSGRSDQPVWPEKDFIILVAVRFLHVDEKSSLLFPVFYSSLWKTGHSEWRLPTS